MTSGHKELYLSTAAQGADVVHALNANPELSARCLHCDRAVELDPEGRGWYHPSPCDEPLEALILERRAENLDYALRHGTTLYTLDGPLKLEAQIPQNPSGAPVVRTPKGPVALLLPGDRAPRGIRGIELEAAKLELPELQLSEFVEYTDGPAEEGDPYSEAVIIPEAMPLEVALIAAREGLTPLDPTPIELARSAPESKEKKALAKALAKATQEEWAPAQQTTHPLDTPEGRKIIDLAQQRINSINRLNQGSKWERGLRNYPTLNRFPGLQPLSDLQDVALRAAEISGEAAAELMSLRAGSVMGDLERTISQYEALRETWESRRIQHEEAGKLEVTDTRALPMHPDKFQHRTTWLRTMIQPANALRPDAMTFARTLLALQEAERTGEEKHAPEIQNITHGLQQLAQARGVSKEQIQSAFEELEKSLNEQLLIRAQEIQKEQERAEQQENLPQQRSEGEHLAKLIESMESAGYKRDHINATWAALRCTRITILMGPSGSGKSSLLESMAQICNWGYHLITVHPDWASGEDLIARPGTLGPEVISGPLGEAMVQALNERERVHLAVLDELNLAVPEHIMNDLISVLEASTPEGRKIRICSPEVATQQPDTALGKLIREHHGCLPWPENLLLAATANEDHTTQSISDRLRDRSGVLRLTAPQNLDALISAMQGSAESATRTIQSGAAPVSAAELSNWSTSHNLKAMDHEAAELIRELARRLAEIDPELISMRSGQAMLEIARLQAETHPQGKAVQDADLACALTFAQRSAERARMMRDDERVAQLEAVFTEFFGPDSMSVAALQ